MHSREEGGSKSKGLDEGQVVLGVRGKGLGGWDFPTDTHPSSTTAELIWPLKIAEEFKTCAPAPQARIRTSTYAFMYTYTHTYTRAHMNTQSQQCSSEYTNQRVTPAI